MEMPVPNVRTTLRDEARNLTFHLMAYRKLRREELVLSVRQWSAQIKAKRNRPRDQIITILTIFGATPNL